MKLDRIPLPVAERSAAIIAALQEDGCRLGLISSIDGSQLITVMLNTGKGTAACWETPLVGTKYHSLTSAVPQCHWFERATWDMFGLQPEGHPRLKHILLHEPYALFPYPLNTVLQGEAALADERRFKFLEVKGQGVYEIPVGPIHAGIIEPGHFRFSCLGELIVNLEIHLGYVHRGVEKRLTAVPWKQARFVAEAAASDSAVAHSLAHAIALESIMDSRPSLRAQQLRTLALEIERIAMHVCDLGGLAADIGFLAISSAMARLRGDALRAAELLTGSRLQRGFVLPGGIAFDPDRKLSAIRRQLHSLKVNLKPVTEMFLGNQVACDRFEKIGRVSAALAKAFGLVGVVGRASGISYDCRHHFEHGVFPAVKPEIAVDSNGDILSRTKIRIAELNSSFQITEEIFDSISMSSSVIDTSLPAILPGGRAGMGIVESHRGELIHAVFTAADGNIERYAIKDASFNNWTGLAIAVRNNLVADFPLCNKSFSLSYAGHDL